VLTTLAVGVPLGFLVLMVVFTYHDRRQASRWLLWVGLLAPMALTEQTLASELSSPALSARDMLRAAIPFATIVIAALASRPAVRIPPARLLPYAGFVGWAAMSTVWSVSPTATLFKSILLGFQAIILVMLARRYDDQSHALRGLISVLLGLAASTMIGIVVAPSLAFQAAGTQGVGRLWGVYPPIHPNTLGLISAFLLIAVVAGQGPRWATSGFGRAVAFLLATGVLVGTRTRYALAVAALLAAYVFVKKVRTSKGAATLMPFVVVAGILGVVALAKPLSNFLVRGQDIQQFSTLTGRTVLWDRALELVALQPLRGYGYYSGHRTQISALPGSGTELSNLDNMWIESLVDVGWIGTLLLVVFVLVALTRGWKADLPAAGRNCLRALLVAGLIASVVNPSIQTVGYAAVIWGMVLMTAVLRDGRPRATDPAVELGTSGTARVDRDRAVGRSH
jgi:O-antigen ligase